MKRIPIATSGKRAAFTLQPGDTIAIDILGDTAAAIRKCDEIKKTRFVKAVSMKCLGEAT